MLYAGDARIVSQSAEGFVKMMTVIVIIFEAAGLTVSEKKTETMLLRTHRTRHPVPHRSSSRQQARGIDRQRSFFYLGGLIDESADMMPEIKQRVRLAWACYSSRFKQELDDMEADPFALKLRVLKAEVMETLLYGCVTWTLGKEHFA